MAEPFFRETRAVQRRTVFGGAPCLRLWVYGYIGMFFAWGLFFGEGEWMKFKQLQCIAAIVQSGFNVTAAAEVLHMSQPAVSKQVKMAEELLGVPIFRRNRKAFVGLTEVGEAMMPDIERIMVAMDNIARLSEHHNLFALSQLSIATTHTLAHNRLVQILPAIQHDYPQLPMNVIEGTNAQILQMVQERDADFAWFSASDLTPYNLLLRGLFMLPAESWSAVAVAPRDHAITQKPFEGLTSLAPYPLITYVTSHKEPSALARAMAGRGLAARIVLTARNAEMIKSYVRQGLGIGVIADMAFDADKDSDLAMFPLERWMPIFNTYLVWHNEMRLRAFHYDLIDRIVPGATREAVEQYVRKQQSVSTEPGWAI